MLPFMFFKPVHASKALRSLLGVVFGLLIVPLAAAQTQNSSVPAISDQTQMQQASAVDVRSENFRLIGPAELDIARQLVTDLEVFRSALLDITDAPDTLQDETTLIYYIQSWDEFTAITNSPTISALYVDSELGPRILLNAEMLSHDPEQLRPALFHEYVHHANFWFQGRNLPIWMNEGLAEYYSTFERTSAGQYIVGQSVSEYFDALESGGWTPIVVLFDALHDYPEARSFNALNRFRSQSYFYAQSWLIMHYILNLPNGEEKLDQFVESLDPLRNSEDAFREAFGMGYIEFETELRRYMDGRTLQFDVIDPALEAAPEDVTTSELPSAAYRAELYLLSSQLNPLDAGNAYRGEIRDQMSEAERSALQIIKADALRDFRKGNYEPARQAIAKIRRAFPADPFPSYLDATISILDIYSFADPNLPDVRAKLREAIARNPNRLRLKAMLLSTYNPDRADRSAEAKALVADLLAAQFDVKRTELILVVVPYLEALGRYEASDRALRIAKVWHPDSGYRSDARQKELDVTYSRPQP